MIIRLRTYLQHPLIRPVSFVLVSSFIINVANYIFTLASGRLLPPYEFATVTTLFSLLVILSVPAQAITTTTARSVSEHLGNKKIDEAEHYIAGLIRGVWHISLVLTCLFLLIIPWLSRLFHIQWQILLLFSIIIPLTLLSAIFQGGLQGLHQFRAYSVFNCLQPLIKLIIGIGLLLTGLSVIGVIMALIIGSMISIFYGKNKIFISQSKQKQPAGTPSRYFFPIEGRTILVITLLITLLTNGDIFFAKHYLSADEAGYYAALSQLGKIMLYATPGFSAILLPVVAALPSKNYVQRWRFLHMSLPPILIVGFILLAGFYVWPQQIIRFSVGPNYIQVSPLLIWFGLGMLCNAIATLYINYLIAIRHHFVIVPLIVAFFTEVILFVFFHTSLGDFTAVTLLTQSILLTGLSCVYLASRHQPA